MAGGVTQDAPATIAETLVSAVSQLTSSPTRCLDAEVLLSYCLGCARSHLKAWPERVLDDADARRFWSLVARRAAGEPIAYLVGEREFWSLRLKVTSDTLIPRPETERLVELALQRLPQDQPLRIADIGTGTGAIALAIARERSRARIVATDASPAALAVAQENATRHDITNVKFRLGDLCAPLTGERYDMICSNPPYVRAGDPHLREGDLPYEPITALVAGQTGLEFIERIARTARELLFPSGWLLLEHGYDQAQAVTSLLKDLGYSEVQRHQDLAGVDRVVLGRFGA